MQAIAVFRRGLSSQIRLIGHNKRTPPPTEQGHRGAGTAELFWSSFIMGRAYARQHAVGAF